MNRHNRRALAKTSHGLLVPARHRAEFESRQREGEVVHELVAATARVLSEKAYEKIASQSNNFYKAWPNIKDFVDINWPDMIAPARKALAHKLGLNSTDESEKELIYEALLLDRSLPKSQTRNLDS